MLPREVMGVFCLGVLWLTALLVAAAAWQEARDLLARARRLRPLAPGAEGEGFVAGVVASGDAEGALAVSVVRQVGRAVDASGPTIAFHDRGYASEVCGGTVRAGDTTLRVRPAEGARAEVWLTPEERAAAAGCPGDAAFEAAYPAARKARGFAREVRAEVRVSRQVWVHGAVQRDGAERVVQPPAGAPLLVATMDPRRLCTRGAWLALAFALAELAACAAVTRVCLWRPVFGTVSTVGGVLALAFFLGVTPLGVSVRDRLRPPSRAVLRGEWSRPQADAATQKSGTAERASSA